MGTRPELCVRFHKAVELIGRRWSGAVIQILLLRGRTRYGELRAAIPDISDRMLSERLRELEDEGVVVRTVVPDTPVRVEYELTDKGRALESALAAIGQWAERWVPAGPVEPDPPRARLSEPAPAAPRRQRPPGPRRAVQRRR